MRRIPPPSIIFTVYTSLVAAVGRSRRYIFIPGARGCRHREQSPGPKIMRGRRAHTSTHVRPTATTSPFQSARPSVRRCRRSRPRMYSVRPSDPAGCRHRRFVVDRTTTIRDPFARVTTAHAHTRGGRSADEQNVRKDRYKLTGVPPDDTKTGEKCGLLELVTETVY